MFEYDQKQAELQNSLFYTERSEQTKCKNTLQKIGKEAAACLAQLPHAIKREDLVLYMAAVTPFPVEESQMIKLDIQLLMQNSDEFKAASIDRMRPR
jgi:hypothetical protein